MQVQKQLALRFCDVVKPHMSSVLDEWAASAGAASLEARSTALLQAWGATRTFEKKLMAKLESLFTATERGGSYDDAKRRAASHLHGASPGSPSGSVFDVRPPQLPASLRGRLASVVLHQQCGCMPVTQHCTLPKSGPRCALLRALYPVGCMRVALPAPPRCCVCTRAGAETAAMFCLRAKRARRTPWPAHHHAVTAQQGEAPATKGRHRSFQAPTVACF